MRLWDPTKKTGYITTGLILAALLSVLCIPGLPVRYVSAAVLTLAAVAVCLFVKKRSILSFNKRQVLLLLTVIAAVYLVLLYVSGVYFGFVKRYIAFSFESVYRFILPITLIIFSTEIIRSVLLAQCNRTISVALYIFCVLTELAAAGGFWQIKSSYLLMDFVGMTVFPAITSNLLYHYISKRYGAYPIIAFRAMLSLYIFVIPFVPNLPDALVAFFRLLLPLLAYWFIHLLYEKKKRRARERRGKAGWAVSGIAVLLMLLFVMLVSCQFRYGVLVIGSPSMTGEINKGDTVFFEKYEDQTIEKQDVIIFEKTRGERVVHRVIDVMTIDGQVRYVTKGDANPTPDYGYVTDDQILGVVQFKILYIGYPSLWLKQIFD